MKTTPALQIKVGLLVLVSLVVLASIIFFMGKERRLFERRLPYEIHFSRTIGLRVGASVSLAGVTVGSVQSLTFPSDLRKNYVIVRIQVVEGVAPRIDKKVVARIRTQGVLGDKFIELSGEGSDGAPLPPGSLIASVDPVDYESLLSGGGEMVQNITEAADSLNALLESVKQGKGLLGTAVSEDWAETSENLRSASASLKNILASVEKGEGLLGQLIENRELGKRGAEDLRVGLDRFRQTAESLHKTAEKLERGEGTLGRLIQDPEAGKEILQSLRRSAAHLESVTRQLREGEGVLPRLIRDKPYADRVFNQLEQTTRDLAQITGRIERGEGTLGALVNDPELYQEAKRLVGNVKGSWLFSIYRFFHNLPPADENSSGKKGPGQAEGAGE